MTRKGNGEAYRWLLAHVEYDGEGCLIWPFFRNSQHGRGQFGLNGQLHYAHRFMCELVHGPAPSKRHHAAHSCGNGHEGCVHPKHLDWKTPEANHADRYIHKRIPYRKTRALLNPEKVAEIRALEGKMTLQQLAEKFGVSAGTIWEIHKRRTWKNGTWSPSGFAVKPYRRPKLVANVR